MSDDSNQSAGRRPPRRSVTDWATDFDHLGEEWAARAPEIGAELRSLSFLSANRDPAHFERPEEVVLDRTTNRHLAFGVGVHRCLGSNPARMELKVARQRWLARLPEFEPPGPARWSIGARGPTTVPLRILRP